MKPYFKLFPLWPASLVRTSDASLRALTSTATSGPRTHWKSPPEVFIQQQNASAIPLRRLVETACIYIVDDAPRLTELYTTLLGETGYVVRAFNDRVEALVALKADKKKPDLLITDYRGVSMSIDRFMHQCLLVHPTLRILMASGFSQTEVRFSSVRPDRFIEKPFTPDDLLREVRAALAAQ
jgi:CheY-like chemotaxis protein